MVKMSIVCFKVEKQQQNQHENNENVWKTLLHIIKIQIFGRKNNRKKRFHSFR